MIQEWPLGDREERLATLIVIDNDGSQSTTQFTFRQEDNTSDDTFVFLLLSILTLLIVTLLYKTDDQTSIYQNGPQMLVKQTTYSSRC